MTNPIHYEFTVTADGLNLLVEFHEDLLELMWEYGLTIGDFSARMQADDWAAGARRGTQSG